jgi:asparagine synthase (glutamine-hydrolysing)
MCGIAGVFNLHGRRAQGTLVERMVATLGHRGPDGRGCHVGGAIAMGHARFSIIDVAGGQQPMTNEDGSLWITFNGEIFNYVELWDELERKGHRFATRSDTEVILHLYEEKGEDCVTDFNGQWAFALWDNRRRRLFLSRDRLGVRPLFYTFVNQQFLFASEAKALFAHPGVTRDLDLEALDQIFTFWTPLAPRTIFRQVSELPPGHSLSITGEGCRTYTYWRPDYRTMREPADPERCADELLDLLVDATRIRLCSEVPVGVYLSGGIDSTVVTTIITRFTESPLRTFSVTFEDLEFDESAYQDEVIAHLQADHARVRCSAADIAGVFPDVIWHTERPIVRTAPAPLYLLSRLVRDSGYMVVLTGEGSDEMLGGYDIFKEAKIRAFMAAHPDSSRRPQLLKRPYLYLNHVQAQSHAYLKAFFRVEDGPSSCFFSHLPRWQLTARLKLLFSADAKLNWPRTMPATSSRHHCRPGSIDGTGSRARSTWRRRSCSPATFSRRRATAWRWPTASKGASPSSTIASFGSPLRSLPA